MKSITVALCYRFAAMLALGLLACGWGMASGFSVNGSATPNNVYGWYGSLNGSTTEDVGWLVTPNSSFSMGSIGTNFGSAGSQTDSPNAVIFSGLPTSGGKLIEASNTTIVPPTGGVATFNFATPLNITAGDSYFVGFENVYGLGNNVTNQAGATNLGAIYYDFGGDNFSYTYPGSQYSGCYSSDCQPIITMTPVVPESNGSLLLLAGLMPLAAVIVLSYRSRTSRRS